MSELNSHVSLSQDWISHHSKVLDTLVENQSKINTTLQMLLDVNADEEKSLIQIAKFSQILAIFE